MKHLSSYFLLILYFMMNQEVFAQAASSPAYKIIPPEYQQTFKEDERKFLKYTDPATAVATRALNLWRYAAKGQIKSYNPDSLYQVYKLLSDQALLRKIAFIKEHPDSYASLYYFNLTLLNRTRIKPDSLGAIFRLLSKDIQETDFGRAVSESINRKEFIALDAEMPVFSFKTDKGEEMNLVSFRGKKYVLICFWASWCGPCLKGIPYLKKFEAAYRDKGLQLISITSDEDSAKWTAALKKYEMSWIQTSDQSSHLRKGRISDLYEVHYIPQYFLLNKEGKLVYQRSLTEEDEDYSSLKDILHRVLD